MTQIRDRVDAQTYLEHFKRDGRRIADVARGHLDAVVPTCPGNTVASLLIHTGMVCMFWRDAIVQNRYPQSDWTGFPTDPLEAHISLHTDVVRELESRAPDSTTWTWFGDGPVLFWYRRAGLEFAVHRWDFENALGDATPIDPALAADGIDEMIFAFGTATGQEAFLGGCERFAVDGQTLRFQPTDQADAFTFTAFPDHFEVSDSQEPDVTARGSASDLLLFLWGRVPPSALHVDGDATLLERWQERVRF